MEFLILGTMEVLDGAWRASLPTGRGRALLALLALHAGEVVPSDRIIDELWQEQAPPTASTVVQGLVSRLRTVLEPDRVKGRPGSIIETGGGGYRLAVDPHAVDAHRFRHVVEQARRADDGSRAAKLADALALWRGPALADFTYMPFAQRAISALEQLRIEATEDRIEAELMQGRGGEPTAELETLVREHPFRERLRGFLMLALYRAGRQADALDVYRATRALLVDEIGVEPGPELRELEAAILRQDPSLEVPVARHSTVPGEAEHAWLPRERRQVTVVAVDATPAGVEQADAEAAAGLTQRAVARATEVLERHGARVEPVLGGLVMAIFGYPLAHEDDAVRAARAAAEVSTAIAGLNGEMHEVGGMVPNAQIGIECGDIIVRGPGTSLRDLAGPVLNTASRLQQAADDGGVLVGPGAQRLLRGAVILRAVAGETGAPKAWTLLEILTPAHAVTRARESPMVGRQRELTQLRSAFRRVVRTGETVRSAVLGDAGIGKSRLVTELVASLGSDAGAIVLRCQAYGTSFPVREAVIQAAGVTGWRALHDLLAGDHDGQHVPPEIAAAIGLPAEPSNTDALAAAAGRLFDRLTLERPLVVLLEDLHWAEHAYLDMIDRIEEATHRVHLVCVARPELKEARPGWNASDTIHLDALAPEDVEGLILERAPSITPTAMRRIVDTSQGNPLFAEQLLAALDEGADDAIPVTLLGLLTMRLDNLGPAERDLLRCASIVGSEFDRAAVASLLPDDAHRFAPTHLDTLERRRLIERRGGDTFGFRHVLIRSAAYQSMTREDRALLHQRFADWLEQRAPDATPDVGEPIEYHRAQVADHRRLSGMLKKA